MKALTAFLLLILLATPLCAADTWVFLGDSLTVATIGNGAKFKSEVKAAYGVDIEVHNTSRVGKHSYEYVNEIDSILRKYPNAKYFPFMIGTNDVLHYSDSQAKWLQGHLVKVLDKIKAAGRVPILFRIPFRKYQGGDPLAAFNTKVYDPLIAKYSPQWFDKAKNRGLLDMHSFLKSNPSYLAGDGVHMTSAGNGAARKTIHVGLMAKVVYGRGQSSSHSGQTNNSIQFSLLGEQPPAVQNTLPGNNVVGNGASVHPGQHGVIIICPGELSGSGAQVDQLPPNVNKEVIEKLMQSVLKARSKADGIFALCQLEAAFARADRSTLQNCKDEIKTYQLLITALGYSAGGVDGLYGPKTRAAGQKVRVALAQAYLKALGFDAGKIDGIEGPITRRAISACSQAGGPAPNGAISQEYVISLRQKHGKPSII